MNIFLTGATGILGSHILFELLLLYNQGELSGKVVLLARPTSKKTASQRIREILTSEVIPDKIKTIPLTNLLSHVVIVSSGLNDFSREKLPSGIDKYTVIHAAASVNLGQNKKTCDEILNNNYQATIHLLNEMAETTSDFIFVSTAYSSGHREGRIENDFLSHNNYQFRNYYEIYKHKTEEYIAKFCPAHHIGWKIIRPSIICGRLIDTPHYVISRFMVFYLFARYAIAMKNRLCNSDLRLYVPEVSNINIIPVDYVAKAIVACMQSDIRQLNVVHPKNVSCRSLFTNGFNFIRFNRYSFHEHLPKQATFIEKMLQSTIGQQLGPYIETPVHYFDTADLKKLMEKVELPEIEDHFTGLIGYAVKHKFASLF